MAAARRDLFQKAIERAFEEAKSNEFTNKTAGDIKDLTELLVKNWDKFEDEHLNLISTMNEAAESMAQQAVYEAIEKMCLAVKKVYRERMEELTPSTTMAGATQIENRQVPVIVKPPDSLSNVVNTWNTFSGKHKDWLSFRDRFLAGTKELDPVNQLHLLQAAVKGEAAKRMSYLPLTKENFQISLNRLKKAYEDKYLVVQDIMRTLTQIPRLTKPSRKGIRNIIDTTEECLNQLKNYVSVENCDIWIVFRTIDLLDSITRKEWEIYRKGLAKQNKTGVPSTESTRIDDTMETTAGEMSQIVSSYIPVWSDMQSFLEEQAGVLMHAENDDPPQQMQRERQGGSRDSSASKVNMQARQQKTKQKSNDEAERPPTGYAMCKACNGDHSIFRCPDFCRWDLQKRREFVINKNLCYYCVRNYHGETNCGPKPNKPCPRCPNRQFHNSYLCPTREAERNTAYLNEQAENEGEEGSRGARGTNTAK